MLFLLKGPRIEVVSGDQKIIVSYNWITAD